MKRAFTIAETLLSVGVISMLVAIGLSVIFMMTSTLYDGQTEETNRSSLSGCIFYLTREIQSAEMIRIYDGGKSLEIKEVGADGYNLRYTFEKGYPTDGFCFKGKKMFDIAFDESIFEKVGNSVKITIMTVKNSTETNQSRTPFEITVSPRNNAVWEEDLE